MRRKICIALCLTIVWVFGMTGSSLAKTEIIRVGNREAASLIPMVKQIMSEDGKVTADRILNAIIITDTPEVCEETRALIARLDVPARQVTIRVRLIDEGQAKSRGASVGDLQRGHRGVGVTLRDGSRDSSHVAETMISVLSGNKGYINVAEMVPYSERWVFLFRRYAHVTDVARFYRLDTGMEVSPIVRGDNVMIEVTPRITYFANEDSGMIRFVDAATTLVAPRNRWVSLGGSDVEANEVIREILTRTSSHARTGLLLLLKADF
jgi:hypothetical protein